MSPWEETRAETRRINRKTWWMVWAVTVSVLVILLSVGFAVRGAQRTSDLARAQDAAREERFRNTLTSCEEQNSRNAQAKKQLGEFLRRLPASRPRTPEQEARSRLILDEFTDTLADAFVPARVDEQGRSTCLAYARERVKPTTD